MRANLELDPPPPTTLVYDGDCPVCSGYVARLQVRQEAGRLVLQDARRGGALVDEIRRSGHDLDRGPVLIHRSATYTGPDCVHQLALIATGTNLLSRLHAAVFRHRRVAQALHPWLRRARLVVLWLLGRRSFAAAKAR